MFFRSIRDGSFCFRVILYINFYTVFNPRYLICILKGYEEKISLAYKFGGENMSQDHLVLHQTMEIHELLNLKTATLLKSKLIQGLVFDQELKALLEKDVQQCIIQVETLQNHLNRIHPH